MALLPRTITVSVSFQICSGDSWVSSVDFHPSFGWVLLALRCGDIQIWSIDTGQIVRSFKAKSDKTVFCARFIDRKFWVATGSEDKHVRIFNYNTMERVHKFKAHDDWVR